MEVQNFNTFKNNLTSDQKELLIHYFDEIYECNELTEHEYKISYLAYLWKNNMVVLTDSGYEIIDEYKLGLNSMDYEITFEDEDSGGVNLSLTYGFYGIDRLMALDFYNDQNHEYKDKLDWMEEYHDKGKEIVFDPYEHLSRKTLKEIVAISEADPSKEYFESYETMDEDFKSDFTIINEHIIFAYGVKHEYIKLSTDRFSLKEYFDCFAPYFIVNTDYLEGEDGEVYPTQYLYEDWKMADWLHLLP